LIERDLPSRGRFVFLAHRKDLAIDNPAIYANKAIVSFLLELKNILYGYESGLLFFLSHKY
jgi:hypothetical protein